jgi:5-formyltetrahydrofolate cyclo-ligase
VLYNANDNEVTTEAIWQTAISHGQAVYYPRITPDKVDLEFVRRYPGERLVPGTFNILIPPGNDLLLQTQSSAIVLTPGVGFDEEGHRLGRGKGYYDRAFRGVLADALRVALAYELQVVPEIPSGPEDELVQWIVTESRLITCVTTAEE